MPARLHAAGLERIIDATARHGFRNDAAASWFAVPALPETGLSKCQAVGIICVVMIFPQGGGCQCGSIRYEISGPPVVVYACHCTECQRQSGAAFAMAAVIPGEHFRIIKGHPKMFARQTSPVKMMECWFCADCGTRLYHVPGGETYPNRNIKPGTLDDTSWLAPTIHFWTRSAQKWVHIPDDSTRHDTQPDRLGWTTPETR